MQLTSCFDGKPNATVCDPSPDLVCGFGIGRDVLVDLARIPRHRADHDGRRASNAHGVAARRRAAGRCDRHFNGAHLLRFCFTTSMVASSGDDDVQLDYCLRLHSWRIESNSPCNHVARDYQRGGVRLRVRLVFLFQAERRRVFLRTEETLVALWRFGRRVRR